MNITIPKAIIEISESEARALFYALRNDLSATIDSHWCRHPGVYTQQAAERIHMMRCLDCVMGGHFFDSDMADLNLQLERATKALATKV